MIGTWIDYSGGTVSGKTMAANNIVGAIRYGGIGGAGKRLTRAEYIDHLDHGRVTVLVVEMTTTDADAGAPAGRANAQAALADLDTITAGLPPIRQVLMANDKPNFVAADVDYIAAAAAEFAGAATVGPYGFGSYVAACAHAGLAPIAWQAGPAPSRTGTSAIATWWQRNGGAAVVADGPANPTTAILDGVVCDLSNQLLEILMTDLTSPAAPKTPDGQPALVGITYAGELDAVVEALLLGAGGGPTWPAGPGLLQRVDDLQVAFAAMSSAMTAQFAAVVNAVGALQKAVAALQPPAQLAGQASVTIALAPPASNPAGTPAT